MPICLKTDKNSFVMLKIIRPMWNTVWKRQILLNVSHKENILKVDYYDIDWNFYKDRWLIDYLICTVSYFIAAKQPHINGKKN